MAKTNGEDAQATTATPGFRKFLATYAPDWITAAVLWAVYVVVWTQVNGFRRQFSLDDTTLHYPYAEHQRVSVPALFAICTLLPLACQFVVNRLTVRSWVDVHHGALGLLLGLSLTGSLTQLVKVGVGRPRPDLLSRCHPAPTAHDPAFGLSTWHICAQPDASLLEDGFRSFPSGHSSMAFAGLGFLACYLAGKMHLFDERGHASKAWTALFPLLGALLVAISRTMDYRHHWEDVTVGSVLGLAVAYLAYRQYFPHLADRAAHLPLTGRLERGAAADAERGSASAHGNGVGRRNGNGVANGGHAGYRDEPGSEDGEDVGEDVGLMSGARKGAAGRGKGKGVRRGA
ncbi:PAP2-domain-containing protein [Coniophora puteana RWD-64-598 SS2]|uniref:PAP2-domain-containing protein n=1 Tax=Coniophora puteana (strain RWD-64-598) TaxID=741705 RepID=A0A5M3M6R9_CONPW|nr:PAP2-domain-containing protein [Coniophora puteana RWD-64-598 SS2]EIW74763.1 PAP2-domain-containing protein [Coniophora puteana RWD-64-598 SS2]